MLLAHRHPHKGGGAHKGGGSTAQGGGGCWENFWMPKIHEHRNTALKALKGCPQGGGAGVTFECRIYMGTETLPWKQWKAAHKGGRQGWLLNAEYTWTVKHCPQGGGLGWLLNAEYTWALKHCHKGGGWGDFWMPIIHLKWGRCCGYYWMLMMLKFEIPWNTESQNWIIPFPLEVLDFLMNYIELTGFGKGVPYIFK